MRTVVVFRLDLMTAGRTDRVVPVREYRRIKIGDISLFYPLPGLRIEFDCRAAAGHPGVIAGPPAPDRDEEKRECLRHLEDRDLSFPPAGIADTVLFEVQLFFLREDTHHKKHISLTIILTDSPSLFFTAVFFVL